MKTKNKTKAKMQTWQDKSRDTFVDPVILLQTTERDRQSGRTRQKQTHVCSIDWLIYLFIQWHIECMSG